jgi:hypothetical protein
MNHHIHIARYRYYKQQNAEIQEIMRNDLWYAEKAVHPIHRITVPGKRLPVPH